MRRFLQFALLLACALTIPALAHAQTITQPCPAGDQQIAGSPSTTNDPTVPPPGTLRFNVCLEPNGRIYINADGTGSSGGGGGQVASPSNLTDTFDRSSLGSNYSNLINAVTVSSGAATGTAAANYSIAGYTGTSSTAVQHAIYVVSSLGDGNSAQGPALLISGTAHSAISLYVCEDVSNVLGIAKITAISDSSNGSATLLGVTAITSAIGDIIDFSYVDGTLSCTWNPYSTSAVGVQVTDNSLTTGTPGFLLFNTGAQSSGFTLNNPPNRATPTCDANIIADGDSVTMLGGPASGDYVQSGVIVKGSLKPCISDVAVPGKCMGVSCATGSSVGNILSMVTTAATTVDPFFVAGVSNYVVIWGCTNDIALASQTPAQCYTNMTTYIAARHAAGWKVIAVPPLSRTGFDNLEADLRLLVMANTAGADAVVQLPYSIASLGAFRNSLLFVSGGIHPTMLGNSIIKDAISAAINSLR